MVHGQGYGYMAGWGRGRGYSRRAAVEAGILEGKDMDRALITGSAQEGRVMAEVDAGRETSHYAYLSYGVESLAHHVYPVLTSRGWQGQCLGVVPPVFPWTVCQKGE